MKRIILLIFLVMLWASGAGAATYYVDCNADGDAGAGTTTAANVAWKTIAKVNASSFSAGDSILFNKGCTWREQLTVPSSGSSGSPITFGAYGTGANPIISGSDNGYTFAALGSGTEETGGIFASGLEDEVADFTTDFTSKTTNGTNTLTVSTAAGTFNNGAKGAKVTFDGTNYQAFATKTITDAGTVYSRVYFKLNAAFEFASTYKGVPLIAFYDGATRLGFVSVMCTGTVTQFKVYAKIEAIGGSAADVYAGSAGEIVRDNWYYVELMFKAGTGADGGIQVWLNGTSKGSVVNRNLTTYAVDTVNFGPGAAGTGPPLNTSELYWDDAKIDLSAIGAATIYQNIWQTAETTEPLVVWFNGTSGVKQSSIANLSNANDWFWGSNVLSVKATSDPSATTEVAQRAQGINVNGKNYLTFNDLTIQHTGTGEVGAGGNIWLQGAWGNIIFNSITSTQTGWHGMGVNGAPVGPLNINNCTFSYTDLSHNQGYGSGIDVTLTEASSQIIIVQNSIFTKIGSWTGSGYHDHGIYNKGMKSITRYNLFTDGGTETGAAIKYSAAAPSTATDGCEAYYNIITSDGGTQSWGILAEAGANHLTYNNVFYGVGTGIWMSTGSSGMVVKNNIFHTTTYKFLRVGVTTDFISGNNVFYNGPATPFTWGATGYSLADWKTNSSQDANSLSSDPLFISATDFHLQAGSPAINAGTNVGLTSDYEGGAIYGTPDIGAYEYLLLTQRGTSSSGGMSFR